MRKLILFTAAIFLLASCYRKPLYDECICYDYAKLPISADWSNLDEAPLNVTVLFYDDTTGELVKEIVYAHNDEEIQYYASVSVGTYTAVIFNEIRSQIDYLTCSGEDNLSTLEFAVKENTKAYSKATDGSYIQEPGDLAVQIVRSIDVTVDLIDYTVNYTGDESETKVSEATKATSTALLGLVPENKMMDVEFKVHVGGIFYSRTPVLIDLENVAKGYLPDDDINSSDEGVVQFYATSSDITYYDGDAINGYLTASTKIVGPLGIRESTADQPADLPLKLSMLFLLIDADATPVTREADITDMVEIPAYTSGRRKITLELEVDELPEVEGIGGDSGMDTSYEDWVNENVNLGL